MKNVILVLIVITPILVSAQIYDVETDYKISGNVGIGTTNPEEKLHVMRNDVLNSHFLDQANIIESSESRLQIISADSQNAAAMLFLSSAPSTGSNKHWSFHHTGIDRNDRLEIGYGTSTTSGEFWDLNARVTILTDGKFGIGTSNPQEKLHVLRNDVLNSHFLDQANIFESVESRLQIISADSQNAAAMLFLSSAPSTGSNKHWSFHHTGVDRNDRLEIGYGTSSESGEFWNLESKMTILTSGYVGIGTNSPQSKLAVNGQIRATEVKVLAEISVPDYVFEPDYELRTLKETKEYIEDNKHLPEIPSASEIGENGIDLGDMNMRLLKKIEEMTLYQIELLERIEELEKKVK